MVKKNINSENIRNIEYLKQVLQAAVSAITSDDLGRVWKELDVCRAARGARIELR